MEYDPEENTRDYAGKIQTRDRFGREISGVHAGGDTEFMNFMEYGENGKPLRGETNIYSHPDGRPSYLWRTIVTTYEYDNEGRVSENITVWTHYDSDGRITHITTDTDTYVYNETGYTRYDHSEGSNGYTSESESVYEIDEYGSTVSETYIESSHD